MIDLDTLCSDLKRSRSPVRRASTQIILQIFYILEHPSFQTQELFADWLDDFSYHYGDVFSTSSGNRKLDATALLSCFGLQAHPTAEVSSTAERLFFSIQTYFSLLLKLSVYESLSCHSCSNPHLILGKFAEDSGIENYAVFDCYCWPVFELDHGISNILQDIRDSIAPYCSNSALNTPKAQHKDCIKQIYHALIPKPLRHALGEFYTPDWLAQYTLQEVLKLQDFKHIPSIKILDPTCGSGTFLVESIALKRPSGAALDEILQSVYGLDINPLAVLTAKTNYLLSILDLLQPGRTIFLPVFRADLLTLASFPDVQLPEMDLIVGNPPWINWEYMPPQYRSQSHHLWADYGLYAAKGKGMRFLKEEISTLITYLVMDRFLKRGGLLAFVLRQGIFKSAKNSSGFRRFQLPNGDGICVLQVTDLSKLRVFDQAAGDSALFFAKKGPQTAYPVPYYLWKKKPSAPRGAIRPYMALSDVIAQVEILSQQATPAVPSDPTSLWVTAEGRHLDAFSAVLGSNCYKARTGVFTGGANGVYWLKILSKNGELLEVCNVTQRAKRKVASVQTTMEPDYIFPLVRGSDLHQWHFTYDTYILCPHTRESKLWPVSSKILSTSSPAVYAYLQSFRQELDARQGFAGWEKEIQQQEFHAILKVGDYTFSRYKVAWRYIASRFLCAVIHDVNDPFLGLKTCLPNEKIMYISTDREDEAYYLCGMLSSTPVAQCVQSYMNPTSISAHVLGKLNIPTFDPNNALHLDIAHVCRQGHLTQDTLTWQKKLDVLVSRLYWPGAECPR